MRLTALASAGRLLCLVLPSAVAWPGPAVADPSTEAIAWTSVVGASASGSTLTKTGGAGWNAGAISTRALASGDGYVEFTATETNKSRMCGLGNGDANQSYTDIEYAIYVRGDGSVLVWEAGANRGPFGSYVTGDRFRVGVESGVVKYRKNGTTFYTSAVAPTYPLVADSSLYTTGGTIGSATIAGNLRENVSWTDVVEASTSGNSLVKTGSAAWNGGAVSTKFIASGDGYVEFVATDANTARVAGLGNGDASQDPADIEYGISLSAGGAIEVLESGVTRGGFGSYVAGDRFRVGVESGVVIYRRNGAVFYTSAVAPSYPLLVDTALYTTGATLGSVVIAGNLQEGVVWTDVVGVLASGSGLTKPGSAGWNAGAVSSKAIVSAEGYAEFTATEINALRIAGLGNGDTGQGPADIEYGISLGDDGTIQVLESGTSRGGFGSYAAGDRFRVGVESGVVIYRRNGAVFYTSAVAPSYPLLVDTALYTPGATLGSVVIAGSLQNDVAWVDVGGTSISANSLTKTGVAGWNAGAISTRALVSGDGYLEFDATETNTYRMCGLGNDNASQSYTDIEYAIYLRSDGIVAVYESGTYRGGFGSYKTGERFRVGVESGVVKYRRNGIVFYTSGVPPSYPLVVDTALYTTGASIGNVVIAGNLQDDVSWISGVGVSASANTLTKTGTTTAWNAGAVSTTAILSGSGFVEFTATETNKGRMCGLGNGDASQSYTDIEYAINLRSDGVVAVYESGTYRGSFGSYTAWDRVRVGVESGVIKYRKNGLLLYTSARAPTYPLVVDSSLNHPGATLTNVVTSGAFTTYNPVATLTSLSPSIGMAGGGGFTLAVNGRGFVPGSVVRWNGSDRTTTSVSSVKLTASIPASDIASVGTASVSVFNPAPGGGTSNALTFTVNNPVPALASLFPSSHTAGGSAFTLTVNGSSFVPSSVVRWNGSDRTTTFVSGTTLTASITASDIAAAGTASVSVFNPTPGGGTSGSLSFTIVASGSPPQVTLDLFKVDGGAQVPDSQEATTGAPLSINNDDDNGDGQADNANALIDGPEDRRDMARLALNVQPWDTITGTIELMASAPSLIRVFNEQDQPVVLPETLSASRFGAGVISYHVEGLAAGTTTLTLTLTQGATTLSDTVMLVVGQQTAIRLSFDDGPDSTDPADGPNLTQHVLDTLAANRVQNGIHATFFVQTHVWFRGGSAIGQSMMAAEGSAGHHVEIHTGSDEEHALHTDRVLAPAYDVDGDGLPDGQNGLESDMIRAKARIETLTGRTPVKVRPPEGLYNQNVLDTYARVALVMQLWDVDSGDSTVCAGSTVACLQNQLTTSIQSLIDSNQPAMVVLSHDVLVLTVDNLETLLKTIEDAVQHRGRNVRFELLP